MRDIERLKSELPTYEESWKNPVSIQFGTVFECLSGGEGKPYYNLAVVFDIGRSGSTTFEGEFLDKDPDRITREGGTMLRSNIVGLTGEILSKEEYLEAVRRGAVLPNGKSMLSEVQFLDLGKRVDILIQQGFRELPGVQI